jgi:hypothetical protein
MKEPPSKVWQIKNATLCGGMHVSDSNIKWRPYLTMSSRPLMIFSRPCARTTPLYLSTSCQSLDATT